MVRLYIHVVSSSANWLDRHVYMIISEIVTLLFYVISIAFLPEYFGTS